MGKAYIGDVGGPHLIRMYLELRGNLGDLPLALDGLKDDGELLQER